MKIRHYNYYFESDSFSKSVPSLSRLFSNFFLVFLILVMLLKIIYSENFLTQENFSLRLKEIYVIFYENFLISFKFKSFTLFEVFFPEVVLASWIIFLFSLFIFKYKEIKSNNSFFLWYLIKKNFLVFLFLCALFFYFFFAYFLHNISIYYKGFIFDFYVYFVKFFVILLIVLSTGCCYLYYQNFNKTYIFEIPLIFSFLSFFLMFLVSSFDFMSIFFCTEGITFSLVTLLVYNYNYEDSTFSAVKYLVLASISAGLFGFGSAMIFGLCGSTNFYFVRSFILKFSNSQILNNSNNKLLLSVSLVFLLFGFFFKLSIAPMHQWSIDIYGTSNWGLIFIFSTAIKLSFFSVFFRSLYYVFSNSSNIWVPILSFAAIVSLFLGSFGAIGAYNLKDFVAYSSLSQIGFIILGLIPNSIISLASSSLFLFYYMVSMVCFFLILVFFTTDNEKYSIKSSCTTLDNISSEQEEVWLNEKKSGFSSLNDFYSSSLAFKDFFILSFNSLTNFSKRPLAAFCFSLALVNLAGLPPFPGFFSKFFILMTLVNSKFFFYAILALFFNLLSAFYYLRILMLVWINFLSNNAQNSIILEEKKGCRKPSSDDDSNSPYLNFFFNFSLFRKNKFIAFFLFFLTLFMTFSVFFISDIWVVFLLIAAKSSFYVVKKTL